MSFSCPGGRSIRISLHRRARGNHEAPLTRHQPHFPTIREMYEVGCGEVQTVAPLHRFLLDEARALATKPGIALRVQPVLHAIGATHVSDLPASPSIGSVLPRPTTLRIAGPPTVQCSSAAELHQLPA